MLTQAYFDNIQPHIVKELHKAKKSVYIAVAWFTDNELFRILIDKASSGVVVSVLILNDEINRNSIAQNCDKLINAGGTIHLIGGKDELMHNKFCVIDQETVITGSYNWTIKAQDNDENITITKGSKELATDFLLEFQHLQKKYLGECEKVKLDIETIMKRLEILSTSISMQDEEDIEFQNKKLVKEISIKEIPEDLQILSEISILILNKEYGGAAELITNLIEKYKSITTYVDPEIGGLKLEIRSLEIQISSLEDEKAELDKIIYQFEIRYNQELGKLILEYLDLKKTIAKRFSRDNPEDDNARKDTDEAEKEYNEFKTNIDSSKNTTIHTLDDEQLMELKSKFRKITKLTHPDLVDKKFLIDATELFIRAKNAKDRNDLRTINEILEFLENGTPFTLKHVSILEKNALRKEASRLRDMVKNLIKEISRLKNSDAFIKISSIENQIQYISNIKVKLLIEIIQLKKIIANE